MKLSIVVPAAGVGRRFATSLPKQYQPLAGKTVLEWTIDKLLTLRPERLLVAVDAGDKHWHDLAILQAPPVRVVTGGASRAESVLCALDALAAEVGAEDWVMVHDAARPCVRSEDIQKLCRQLWDHPVGGILGVPIGDTIKRIANASIEETVPRDGLWSALTPQLFRFGLLRQALRQGLIRSGMITDEASAVELAGYRPHIVRGCGDNIKITRAEDLIIAEAIFAAHAAESMTNPEGDQQ